MIAEKLQSLNRKLMPGHLHYAPKWLVLGVNNICNLHCKMCDVGIGNEGTNFHTNLVGTHPINMPLELIKQVFDQAHLYFPKVKIGYAFTEPLMYPHLIESIGYAGQKNLHTAVTTNALSLVKKADDLVKSGLNELFISLDGPPEVHNFIRGHKRSFERAIEGIEAIIKHKTHPEISIFCVITEWNIGRLKEFISYFKKYPINTIGYMHTNFTSQEVVDNHNTKFSKAYPATISNIGEIDITKMDLDKLWDEMQAIKQIDTTANISFSPELATKEKLNTFYHHPEVLIGKGCNDVNSAIMIKSDGSVIPAHGRCYNLTVGNLYEQNLKQIWNAPKLSEFRKTLKQNNGLLPACSRCCSAF